MQQQTQHITKEELKQRQREQAFNNECHEKAAVACNILREQLRNREMNDLIKRLYSSNPPQKQDFVFVSRKQVQQEMEKRVSSLQTTTA